MQMKYENMIKDKDKSQFEKSYNDKHAKFKLQLGTFAVFTKNEWGAKESEESENNWKAHISIDPEYVGQAWDHIYPLLEKHADQFKVVDMNRVNVNLPQCREKYKYAKLEHAQFIDSYLNNRVTSEVLKNLAKQFSRDPSDYESLLTDDSLFKYISAKYAERTAIAEKSLEEVKRINDGMQITLYMLPGKEKESKQLLDEIEKVLIEKKIPPGSIYKSDLPIGKYSSVRHPGKKEYQEAVNVKSHNPDNEPDPFVEPIHKYIYNLELIIEQLKSFEQTNDMSEIQKNNVQVKNNLGQKLKNNLEKYLSNDYSEEMRASKLDELKNICIQDIKEADRNIKHDKEWKPLLKNLALILSGIGLVAALVSLYYRHTTGRYGVFDNKEKLYDEVDGKNDFSTQKFYDFKKRYINNIMPKGIEQEQDDKLDEHEEQGGVLVLE